jgi:hypothetical protein
MSDTTFVGQCFNEVVAGVCRKSCQPPIIIASSFKTGLIFRLSTFPGLTGVALLVRNIHLPSPNNRFRADSFAGIGKQRSDPAVLVVPVLPS